MQDNRAPPVQVEPIGGRYRVEVELGRGGMAHVYRVQDERDGQRLALKKLIVQAERGATVRAMFEHEYHVLTQLAHPNIVRAFDYGLDGDSPYYTMELLDGVDARQRCRDATLSVREVCQLLRDSVSALSLIHSRRMVHRDVSPRNLWCTPDGRGKLIDFGTLVAMGPQSRIAGTPPFVPPEALSAQALDARCDLYALGALGYFLLTGSNAYPARTLDELQELWLRRPERPDSIKPELPRALCDLVMSLLSLDARGRPAAAADVYERLTAIGNLPAQDEQLAAQAFLTSPKLVGREQERDALRQRMRRAVQGRGSTVAVIAAAGLGRTRMLESVLLEAKLLGLTAITADAGAVGSAPLALAAALTERLFEALPMAAAQVLDHAPVLGHLSPAVHRALGEPELAALTPLQRTRKLGAAVVALLQTASQKQRLVVAVDDVHRADSSSLGVLGRVALRTVDRRLLLVVSADAATLNDPPPALAQLVETRHRVELGPLGADHTRELLESLFGAVAGIDDAASWLHELSQGSPQTCMHYAQYIVDQGIARYEAGQWRLPSHLREHALPPTLGAMLDRRLAALPRDARELALALALARDESRAVWQPETHVRMEDFPKLLAHRSTRRAFAALDALLAAGIVQQRDSYYVLAQRAMADALLRSSHAAERKQLYLRLAEVFADARYEQRWWPTRMLLLADEPERARRLLTDLATSVGGGGVDWGTMRVSVLADCAARAYTHWLEHGGTPREGILLRRLLLVVCSVYDWGLADHGDAQLKQLRADCGIDRWSQTDACLPELQRTLACIQHASDTYEATPEAQRGLPPHDALRELAAAVMTLSGALGNAHAVARAQSLPEMMAPLRPLTPVLALLADLSALSVQRVQGLDVGDATFDLGVTALLESTGLPDVLKLGGAGVNVHIQSIEDARRGRKRAIESIERLVPFVGEDMFLVVHGRFLAYGFLGEGRKARSLRKQVEVITEDDVWRRNAFLFAEAELAALSGDTTLLQDSIESIAELSERFEGWRPWLAYARGSLHRLHGDLEAAERELDAGLAQAAAGTHRAFTRLSPARAELDLLRGRPAEALAAATAMLERAQALGLDRAVGVAGQRVCALSQSALGDHAAARAHLRAAEQLAAELDYGGLPLSLLSEARARIALAAGDAVGCGAALERLWQLIEFADAPALIHAYESLREERRKQQALSDLPSAVVHTYSVHTDASVMQTQISTLLAGIDRQHERLTQALELLVEDSGAAGGHLFLFDARGLFAAAAVHQPPASAELLTRAQQIIERRLSEVHTVTVTASEVDDRQLATGTFSNEERALAPVLLSDRTATQTLLVGLVLLQVHGPEVRPPRAELVRVVSRCLNSAGDSVPVPLED